MKIDRLKVEGFGHFRQFELELKPGLNVLYGGNEAGKSTLLAFVRAVLFGFEGRKEPERYEDEGGGPFGGELSLQTNQGPMVVRRVGRKRVEGELSVKDGQGAPLNESRLREALFHINKAMFREVFAFSLSELSSLGALVDQKDVSAAVFAAGMQGAHRLPEALAALRASTDALYRPGGRLQELNRALNQLVEAREQLEQLGNRPEAYFAARERLLKLDGEEKALAVEQEQLTHARERQRRLIQVTDDVSALKAARSELSALPDLSAFPEGAVARLEALTQALERAKAQRLSQEEALGRCERALKLASDEKLGPDSEVRLRAAADAFNARCAQYQALPGRREQLNARRRQVDVDLKNLGLRLNAEALLKADFSTAARATLSAIKDRVTEAERKLLQLDERHRAARAKTTQVEEIVRRLSNESDRLPRTLPATVRRAQAAVARVSVLQEQLSSLESNLNEKRAQRTSLSAHADPVPVSAIPLWTVPVAAVVLALVSGMSFFAAGPKVLALAASGSALIFGLLLFMQRRAKQMHERALIAHTAREKQRAAEVARLSTEEKALEMKVEVHRRELLAAAEEAQVPPNAAGAVRDARMEALAEELRGVERRIEISRELEGLSAQLASVRKDETEAYTDRNVAEAGRSRILRELSQVCAPRGFPSELTADHALYLFAEAANLKTRLIDLGAEEQGLLADEGSCHDVVSSLLRSANDFDLPSATPEAAAAAAIELVDRAREGRRDRTRLASEREGLTAQVARAREAETEARTGLERLLQLAGCQDGEALRARDEKAVRYRELTKEVRERTVQIEAAGGAPLSAVEAQLGAASVALPLELSKTEARLGEVAGKLKALEQERGEKKSLLKQWEQDDTMAKLRADEELQASRVSELVQRYSVERMALALLERARARFEKEAQPRVVQLASRLFEGLTGGRYVRAFLPAEKPGELWVSSADGKERAAAQLSRGTREQLYLAFRLAVIEEFAQSRGPLPIIVDDILVNFDEQRTRNTLIVFARLAKEHQFIAFTCHKGLRDAFAAHGANVIEVGQPTQLLLDVVRAS